MGGYDWHAMDGDKFVEMKMSTRFSTDAGIALVPAVLAGLGIAGLPTPAVEEHLVSGALVPVMTRYPISEYAIFVSWPPGQRPSRKVRALTDMLTERFGSESSAGT